jgi:hypothetical protein|tara:strand:+ start:513 stop:1784 length:1272 start_codon:yes stop_codon:yes gene_type:complete
MSDNLDKVGNFSIQDTVETGAGDTQLLNDLFAPETASGNPEDIEPIVNEVEPPKGEVNNDPPKGKDITPPSGPDGKTEEDKLSGESMIADFLTESEESVDEDDVTVDPPKDDLKKASETLDDTTDDEDDGGNKFTALSNDLFSLGVFNKEEDEEVSINTPEEFLERFNAEKKKGASEIVQNFIGQFGEDYQNAFDSIFVKGVDPKQYFNTYNQIVSFTEMDLSKENNQMSVMKQALADQGFEQEDIGKEIERLQNYGDLEAVSTRHHKVLVKKEAKKLQQIESEAEQVQQQKTEIKNQYTANVQNILSDKLKEKEFDGIPINPNLANELQDFLLVDKWKTPAGENLTDFDRSILDLKRPENHEMKVKVGLLLKILEKDPTLSTIQRTGVTKKSNQLFGEVARQVTRSKTASSNKKTKPNSWFI